MIIILSKNDNNPLKKYSSKHIDQFIENYQKSESWEKL